MTAEDLIKQCRRDENLGLRGRDTFLQDPIEWKLYQAHRTVQKKNGSQRKT